MPVPHPEPLSQADYSAVELSLSSDRVLMLDQRRLPEEEIYLELESVAQVALGIAQMAVRGAPAIGIAAAYGMVLAARGAEDLEQAAARLKATRPTAVNLAWAVDRMLRAARGVTAGEQFDVLAAEARAIHREDVAACRRMGELGAQCLAPGTTVLTHCNAGALATGGYGTALGVIRAGHAQGKIERVLADETRPYLQGARLTAWELARAGIVVDVIADGAAAHCMQKYRVSSVIVGADRIAANADVANKIGTLGLAINARHHGCRFLVAAPWSTVDRACPDGSGIPIEERDGEELRVWAGKALIPQGAGALNPAFDVTPAALIDAIVTERGVVAPPDGQGLAALAERG